MSAHHPIPAAALDERLAFLGLAGSGKTYNAGVAVERLLERKARVCIIDPLGAWWGLRLSADGKEASPYSIVIFGGPHADIAITEASGALVGETVANMAESCIIDLSEIGSDAAERRFMLAFLTALYKHQSKSLLHLIIDEADMWAPQQIFDKEGGAAQLVGKMQNIVRRGRIKGFICWLITQRPAVLSWGVLSQVIGIVAFTLTSSQDRDAIGRWVKGQADKERWNEIWGQLAELPVGEGLVWVPRRKVFGIQKFPAKTTFDSSRAPRRGEKRTSRKLKPLDVDALQGKLAKVEAEKKANDPAALRTENAALKAEKVKLEQQLAAKAKAAPASDPAAIAEAEKRGFEQRRARLEAEAKRAASAAFSVLLGDLTAEAGSLLSAIKTFADNLDDRLRLEKKRRLEIEPVTFTAAAPAPAPARAVHNFAPAKSSAAPKPPAQLKPRATNGGGAQAAGDASLGKGERIMLTAIAQYPDGATREQLTVLTGYKRSSRDTYIQRLGAGGLVDIAGNAVRVTQAGIEALGPDFAPLPTGEALQAYWLDRLSGGEHKILQYLLEVYPQAIGRDALDEPTGYKRSARDTYIQRLAARKLVAADRGQVKAADILFQAAA